MTERKPPTVSYETWIERQIRLAQERGEFDDLPGAGRPLGHQRPTTAQEWVADWARREGADLSSVLPPALAMRRRREDVLVALPGLRSEPDVRQAVADVNERLREAYRRPTADGPAISVPPLDADRAVATWLSAQPLPPVAPVDTAPAEPRRRRWWRR